MKTKIISKILLSLGLMFMLGSAITPVHGGIPRLQASNNRGITVIPMQDFHGHPRQEAVLTCRKAGKEQQEILRIQSFSSGATQSGTFAAGGAQGDHIKSKTGNVTDRNLNGAGAGNAVANGNKPKTGNQGNRGNMGGNQARMHSGKLGEHGGHPRQEAVISQKKWFDLTTSTNKPK